MKNVKKIKVNNYKIKNYKILFCLSFIDFLLLCFYFLLSIVIVTDVNIIYAILLLSLMFCSIYYIIIWQYESNKIPDLKNKKQYSKSNISVKANKSKIFKTNNNQNRKNYQVKLKEQL